MKIEEAIEFLQQYTNNEVYTEKCVSAHAIAITALHSMPEAGEPLSFEQLREMDGKPVWVVPLKKEDWDSHWDVMKHGCAIAESKTKPGKTYFLYEDSYRIRWCAYSYPPAHIDRSKRISVKERLPDDEKDGETVLAIVSGKPHKNITLCHALMTAGYFPGEGWVVNEYPEWENPTITHWMPLPEPPEED